MSVSFTLEEQATDNRVTMFPAWDYKMRRKMNRSDHRMHDASLYSYKWGAYDLFTFGMEGVTPADASRVNSWWGAGSNLLFYINRDGYDPAIPVHIVNDQSPFSQFMAPRTDYYNGKLSLESRYPAGLMVFLLVDHIGDYINTADSAYIGVLTR